MKIILLMKIILILKNNTDNIYSKLVNNRFERIQDNIYLQVFVIKIIIWTIERF